MGRSVCVIGGGIAGLAAAYELARLQRAGNPVTFTLVEASKRLGGILETERRDGFVFECGPDGWVTEKPWARELAEELGLAAELIPSNDETRVTYVLHKGALQAMPDGMRMMVPASLASLDHCDLFPQSARDAYAAELTRADELKQSAPQEDESVASFVERHFGGEVLRLIGAPLLGGVFGGDVRQLSVGAVMKPFVQMEREHGSLIAAVQARAATQVGKPKQAIFTTLKAGTAALGEAMAATLPVQAVELETTCAALQHEGDTWRVTTRSAPGAQTRSFDAVLLAVPVHVARRLLGTVDDEAATLMEMPASSAVIAGFGYTAHQGVRWPGGFGFLAPSGEGSRLLAGTFSDQKYSHRVPAGGRMIRAYFGGAEADALLPLDDETIAGVAREELEKIVGPLPAATHTVVRRWPAALPQYGIGHVERMAALQARVNVLGGLALLGNGYRGVGLPELIRDGRAAARACSDGALLGP